MKIKDIALASSLVAAIAVIATSSLAQVGEIPSRNVPYFRGHDMMWGGSPWGGFGMVLGPIFMILILVGVIAAVIYLLRLSGAISVAGGKSQKDDQALALLKERYAKGDIDSKEFEERKKLLTD